MVNCDDKCDKRYELTFTLRNERVMQNFKNLQLTNDAYVAVITAAKPLNTFSKNEQHWVRIEIGKLGSRKSDVKLGLLKMSIITWID